MKRLWAWVTGDWKRWASLLMLVVAAGAIAGVFGYRWVENNPVSFMDSEDDVFAEMLVYTNEHHALPEGMTDYSSEYNVEEAFCTEPEPGIFSQCFDEETKLSIKENSHPQSWTTSGTFVFTNPHVQTSFEFIPTGELKNRIAIYYWYYPGTHTLAREVTVLEGFSSQDTAVHKALEGTDWTYEKLVSSADKEMAAFVGSWCRAYPRTKFSPEEWGDVTIVDMNETE